MKTLTVNQAARNLASCVKRVYRRHESFELVEKGVPYARLVPVNGTGCNTHELADELAEVELPASDRRALASAIRKGRRRLKSLKNPWA
jgi:antitoxin (DNA-binding transcriptional repressor) of toxin-antitoxin stability system